MSLKSYLAAAPRGTATRLAEHLGVSPAVVSQWIADADPRPVPPKQRPGIEQFTEGEVPVESFEDPGVIWARIKDKSWPWHPAGRPVLDVTKATA